MRCLYRQMVAGLVGFAVLGGGLLCSAAPALAGTGHALASSFGAGSSTPANPSPLAAPNGVAVDQNTGDVYVVDAGNNRVEKFDSSGNLLLAFGGDVGGAGVDTCTSGCVAGNAGSGAGQFSAPTGIAVDNSGGVPGDVYVLDAGNDRVEKFSPSGVYLSQVDGTGAITGPGPTTPFGSLGGVAVDPSGDLWVYQQSAEIDEFHADSSFKTSFNCPCGTSPGLAVDASNVYADRGSGQPAVFTTGGEYIVDIPNPGAASGLASDPAHSDLYIDMGNSVAEYDVSAVTSSSPGTLIGSFGSGTLGNGAGIAVNTTTGAVYVADSATNDVVVFGLGSTPPAPNTDPASDVTASSATLNGDLNPEGATGGLGFYFSYAQGESCTGSGSVTTPLDNGGANATGSSDVSESAPITGLQPHLQYAFCLFSENAFGPTAGAASMFTTPGAPPAIESEAANHPFEEPRTREVLSAQINPENEVTHFYFEYGTSPTLAGASTIPSGEIPAGYGGVGEYEYEHPNDLLPNTVYYYRAVAENATGKSEGLIQEFKTAVPLPIATSGEALQVTDFTARVEGMVNPASSGPSSEASYYIEYGTGQIPATSVECGCITTAPLSIGGPEGGESELPLTSELTELKPLTTYHYRVVAFNYVPGFLGPQRALAFGAERTFTTLPLPPAVTTDLPAGVGAEAATLAGVVGSDGVPATYYFKYGPTSSYGSTTPAGEVGATAGQGIAARLTGLSPQTTYHYVLVATNSGGTVEGAEETLTTAATTTPTETLTAGFSLVGAPVAAPPGLSFASVTGLTPTPPKAAPKPPKPAKRTSKKKKKKQQKKRKPGKSKSKHKAGAKARGEGRR